MEMTNSEICRSFRLAAKKSEQVKILSQLNDCSVNDILVILFEGKELSSQQGKMIRAWLTRNAKKTPDFDEVPSIDEDTTPTFTDEDLAETQEPVIPVDVAKKRFSLRDNLPSEPAPEQEPEETEDQNGPVCDPFDELLKMLFSEEMALHVKFRSVLDLVLRHDHEIRSAFCDGERLKHAGFTRAQFEEIEEAIRRVL